MTRRTVREVRQIAVLLPVVFVIGCGGAATVTGKVTYQGRPVTYGWVSIVSSDRTAKSGVIEADSSYSVSGVRPGPMKIAVGSRNPSKPKADKSKKSSPAEKSATPGWFALPRQYEDPEKSGLDCTIESGHVSHDIDLQAPPK